MQLIPVVLCGGVGSRLWPISRVLHPKPFIRMPDGYSLLQKNILRGAMLHGVQEVLTVTNRELYFKIKEELSELDLANKTTSFILEPFRRNTAAAVAAAALHIAQYHSEETLILVLAADHLIMDHAAFQQAVSEATKLALTGKLITFGMVPYETNTRYGYIEVDDNKVVQFIQQPSFKMAKESVETNRFLWNSSMFLFKAGVLLQAMKEHSPDILSTTLTCLNQSELTEEDNSLKLSLEPISFSYVPERSISEAIMKKSNKNAVVPCDLGWIDMDSWNNLGNIMEADDNGNRILGQACLHDVANCYIQGSDRLIGAVGVENLVIIDTPDALLVADKYCAHDVKHIYTQLKEKNHETHMRHRTVLRSWGSYTTLEESEQLKIKRIEVKQGHSLSIHRHPHHSVHWLVVRGMAKVCNAESTFFLNTNESTYISAELQHSLENPGAVDLVIIEVQSDNHINYSVCEEE